MTFFFSEWDSIARRGKLRQQNKIADELYVVFLIFFFRSHSLYCLCFKIIISQHDVHVLRSILMLEYEQHFFFFEKKDV